MIVEPDDSLAHIGRWRDPQVVDVLRDLAPRPYRVPRHQLPERLELILDPPGPPGGRRSVIMYRG